MKNKFFLSLAGVLFSLISYSQNAPSQNHVNPDKKEKSLEERMEGTYVMIVTNPKITTVLTTEALKDIESRRDDTRDIYYEVSKYLTIKILPRSVINAPDFDPAKYQ